MSCKTCYWNYRLSGKCPQRVGSKRARQSIAFGVVIYEVRSAFAFFACEVQNIVIMRWHQRLETSTTVAERHRNLCGSWICPHLFLFYGRPFYVIMIFTLCMQVGLCLHFQHRRHSSHFVLKSWQWLTQEQTPINTSRKIWRWEHIFWTISKPLRYQISWSPVLIEWTPIS